MTLVTGERRIDSLLLVGTQVGDYRVEGVLGRGGMGTVYEAVQLSLGRRVALKLLAAELGTDDIFRRRFQREGRIQAGIDHNHIVPVYEAGELDGHGLFIAMRLIRGPTLGALIKDASLDVVRTIRILAPIADALDTAHEAQLVHRDVKPQNILVGRRDHAYLADFGLTRASTDPAFTQTGQFVGTIHYVSPEQVHGEPADASSDIYSFAAVAYESLTGSVPYPKPNDVAVMFAHVAEPPPRATSVRPELPARVDDVLMRGMAKAREDRYPTSAELIQDLELALRDDRARLVPLPAPVPQPATLAGPKVSLEDLRAASTAHASRSREAGPAHVTSAGARPAPARTRGTRRRRLLATAAIVPAVAGVGGFLAGAGGGEDAATRRLGSRASSGLLAVRGPTGWRRVSSPPATPGLRLSERAGLEPAHGPAGSAIVVGLAAAGDPNLLPTGFASRLKKAPPPGDAVRLGRAEAYRYEDLRPNGDSRPLTLFVAPTTRGVAVVACLGGTRKADCGTTAASLSLSDGVKSMPLGANPGYAKALTTVMQRLVRERAGGLDGLAAARTARKQATFAGRLASAYAKAASDLARVPDVGPADLRAHRRILETLRRAASDYGALAKAARRRQPKAYSQARTRATRAEAATRRALAALEGHGYSVG